ncbi:glycoside hydrolase family 130 protein [Acidicapsa dinghuensis]|uniref:Glycoside hydrolase family 130 protein n=1 Tax=Acidicapsa dinghuensis TaxID=2218256 RepID=A0ABW1EFU7_9BACT|nr:glycoside hydrolase family 130 protein [Acidicapsa dinghuensis]
MRLSRKVQQFLLVAASAPFIVGATAQQIVQQPTHPQDWALGPFTRPIQEPVIRPNPASVFEDPILHKPIHWEGLHTFNPAAIVRNGKIVVLYRAEDDSGSMQIGMHTSRLGLAESGDGIHFTRMPEPVFYPAQDSQKSREWPGGVEDPRIVEAPDGTYVLTYTQWNRKTYSIGVATSPDLIHWTKHGPALGDTGPYANLAYKSSGIVTHLENGRLIAARIHGKFWMYWGEIQIRLASSSDLIHWTPIEEAPGEPTVVLSRRPKLFDSAFPEVGPPPILTKQGILLLYNGKNAEKPEDHPDKQLGPGAYSVGQALFDPDHPTHLLQRLNQPSLFPQEPYERSGQYTAGTTFGEGLVLFQNKWFLYYGTADSFVGVASAPAGNLVR